MAAAGDASQPMRGLKEAKAATKRGLPPVDKWNPEFCGDIDMRIAADGTWYYMNSPIGRKPLVRLFSTLLRKDEDGKTYLITPVEKVGITVDDAHFVAVAMTVEGAGETQVLRFTTNVEDEVIVDDAHPLRFAREEGTDGLKPYVLVRGRLEALVARPIFYDLVERGCTREVEGVSWFGVWSSGRFYPMAPAAEIGL
ncbi:DUF1285 domain-containing protein [Rhodoligotrophos defluvii]|uniref:DUF1285 domain-containing protein n=1 Tax=Rhodoligotrophos defluvii TaxID=2561934 RepID=UPI0010C96636